LIRGPSGNIDLHPMGPQWYPGRRGERRPTRVQTPPGTHLTDLFFTFLCCESRLVPPLEVTHLWPTAQVGGVVDFVGAVPGVGTKVGATRDLDGYSVVYVNYADFEKEQPR
jgi:hypothetical protein